MTPATLVSLVFTIPADAFGIQIEWGLVSTNLWGTGAVYTAPTPLPGALPLFATCLGVLGLLAWRRRKRKLAA